MIAAALRWRRAGGDALSALALLVRGTGIAAGLAVHGVGLEIHALAKAAALACGAVMVAVAEVGSQESRSASGFAAGQPHQARSLG